MSDDDTTAASSPEPERKGRRGRKGPDADLLARMTRLGATQPEPPPAAAPPTRKPATTRRRTDAVTAPSDATRATSGRRKAPTSPPAADKPPTRKTAARKAAPAPRTPMPAEQPKPVTYSARINLTTTPEQNRALDLARIEDGIDKTARLRAMIALWQQDERLRRRIDKMAQSWR